MNKAIPQRTRHREMHASLRGRIAGGNDYRAVRQHILSEFAIKQQLVAVGLRHLRGRRQLIEKQNAFPGSEKKLGWHSFDLICFDAGPSAQIDPSFGDAFDCRAGRLK
jgi:hypothetical protein